MITGSGLLNDSGIRHEHVRLGGRLLGVLGPGCTGDELTSWLRAEGVEDVVLDQRGAIGYFRGVKHG